MDDEKEVEGDDDEGEEEEEGKAPLFVVVCLGESFSISFLLLFKNYSIAFLVYCLLVVAKGGRWWPVVVLVAVAVLQKLIIFQYTS